MSRVVIEIDRLVLGGLDPAERTAFVEALRIELARTFSASPTRGISRRAPALRLGQMPFERGAGGARRLGAGVARAIGRGVR
jgi:hypothetical protein